MSSGTCFAAKAMLRILLDESLVQYRVQCRTRYEYGATG